MMCLIHTHQSHLQRCAEMLSSQAHVSTQSAIRKREERLPAALALAAAACSQQEECFPQLFPPQQADVAPCDTRCPMGQGRGKKLVTEDSNPVGSGEFIYIA